MNQKNKPQRRCIGCMQMKDKNELVRIVKSKSGEIKVDFTGKAQGRGAYICKNGDCLENAIKQKRLNKSFGCSVSSQIYETLKKETENGK